MQQWTFPSSSSDKTYTATLGDDGLLSCNCRGFYIKRKDKPYSCKHTEDIIKRLGLNIVQRGDQLFGTADPQAKTVRPEKLERTADSIMSAMEAAKSLGYVNPMLASALTKRTKDEPWDVSIKPYQDGNWLAQKKYDGERIVLSRTDDAVYFWSRPRPGEGQLGLPNQKVGQHIREAALYLPRGTYDGEVIAGENLASYDVTNLANRGKQVLVLFDMLRLVDDYLLDKPMTKRYETLEQTIGLVYPGPGHCIKLAELVEPSAEQLQTLWDQGAEGLVLKRDSGTYKPGYRSPDWVKIKREFYEVGTVTGYEKAKNGPYSKLCLKTKEGKETTVKTPTNYWLGEFAKNPDKYIGQRVVFKHYGPTPDGKFRGPIIFDHWAGEGE